MKIWIIPVVVMAMLFVAEQSALPCGPPRLYQLSMSDEQPPEETRAPVAPTLSLMRMVRGLGPQKLPGGYYTETSCDDFGRFKLKIEPYHPDVGYLFKVRSGILPHGLEFPTEPAKIDPDSIAWIYWIDEATDEQEAFSFELEVVAVDVWGRRSEPSNTIDVEDPGSSLEDETGFSCASIRSTRGSSNAGAVIFFMCFGFILRRLNRKRLRES